MIEYRVGDCLDVPERPVVLAHVVNDVGAWGAGFSGALGRRYPHAARTYRAWAAGAYGDAFPFGLGRTLLASVGEEEVPGIRGWPDVAHLCAQRGLRSAANPRPLDASALGGALGSLAFRLRWIVARHHGIRVDVVAMPRIGCGLAGGRWSDVEPIVAEQLRDFRVVVYTLPEEVS